MAIEKILFTTKFREDDYQTLLELTELQKVGLREIVLLHVIPREEVAYVPFGGYLKERALELSEGAKLRLKEWEEELQERGFKVKVMVEIGEPVAKILQVSEEEKANLLVIGRKRSTYQLIPEISEKITCRSSIPVLVYRKIVHYEINGEIFQRENTKVFTKPLLATDFSAPSKRAVNFLLNFRDLIEKIFIVHILKEGTFEASTEEALTRIEEEKKAKLCEVLRDFQAYNLKGSIFLGIGDPIREILAYAREKEATLIAIGKTGKGLLESILVGSLTKSLLHRSEIPLLVVP